MKIPLQNFEQYIDETILKRGYQYFKKGMVDEPVEISHGEYEANVNGTDLYTVRLAIKNGFISEYVCSCPYDLGPVCKHVVAVIFHLQQNEIEVYEKPKKKSGEGKTVPKKKTVTEQVDVILEKVSHEQLKDFIKERCQKDKLFRQLFIANFAFLVIPESKSLYVQQVRGILASYEDRNGFIGYSGSRSVGIAVYELLQQAQKFIDTPHYITSFHIACAVLEEMTKALQFAEDSNGDIGGCIDGAIDVMAAIVYGPVEEKFRIQFFDYFVNAFRKEFFRGWDWHMKMTDLASQLVVSKDEAKVVHSLLDKIEQSDSGWNVTQAQTTRLALIGKIEGAEKAKQFLIEHISNPDFRKIAIEDALSLKDYMAVILLAEEGLKISLPKNQNLIDDWNSFLLKAYTGKNDDENIIKYARTLLMNSYREKEKYYYLLKSKIKKENWVAFVDQIINDTIKSKKRVDYNFIAQIYIWEKRWDKLFNYVKLNLNLSNLDTYGKYLINDYANELAEFYQTAIFRYLELNVGRNFYQNACRYLRKLIKMGYRDKVDYIIPELKKMYPQRKALMEELELV